MDNKELSELYADWIINNKDKKGTKEFEKVSAAYKETLDLINNPTKSLGERDEFNIDISDNVNNASNSNSSIKKESSNQQQNINSFTPQEFPKKEDFVNTTYSPDGSWFSKLIVQESGGKHFDESGKLIESSKQAFGVTQLHKPTMDALREQMKLPREKRDPVIGDIIPPRNESEEEYLRVGNEMFNAYLKYYKGDIDKSLAAYNAGFPRTDQAIKLKGANWLSVMPEETQNYVRDIRSKK